MVVFFPFSINIRSFLAFEASTSPFQCLAKNSHYQAYQVSTTKEVNDAKIEIHRDEFQHIIHLQYWNLKKKHNGKQRNALVDFHFEAGIYPLNHLMKNYSSTQLRLAIPFLRVNHFSLWLRCHSNLLGEEKN